MRELVVLRQSRTYTASQAWDARKAFGTAGLGETLDTEISTERFTSKDEAELARDPDVIGAAPVMPTRLIAPMTASPVVEAKDSWGIAAIGAGASDYTGAGVTVAVLDTGIDARHPAFNGVTLTRRNFTHSQEDDVNGHGTHCAGTIFGRDVGQRMGIARGVSKALIGKVLDDQGGGSSDMVFKAMQWAVDEGANIVSMSLGFDFPGMVRDLVERQSWPADLATSAALEAFRGNLRMFDAIMGLAKAGRAFGRDVIVVAAAGNESRRSVDPDYRIAVSLPAAADDVVSVAAVGQGDAGYVVADFSNSLALVAAPGVDIVSAWPGGKLKSLSGTSMACPHVAGVAALWWESICAQNRRAGAANVTAQIIARATPDRLSRNQEEIDYGQGLVRAP